jgi:hypothetical protein
MDPDFIVKPHFVFSIVEENLRQRQLKEQFALETDGGQSHTSRPD